MEDLTWLVLFAGYLLCDEDASESPMIPIGIHLLSAGSAGGGDDVVVATARAVFAVIDYENAALEVRLLVGCLFVRVVVSWVGVCVCVCVCVCVSFSRLPLPVADLRFLSPVVAQGGVRDERLSATLGETLAWFLRRWSHSFLMPGNIRWRKGGGKLSHACANQLARPRVTTTHFTLLLVVCFSLDIDMYKEGISSSLSAAFGETDAGLDMLDTVSVIGGCALAIKVGH